MPIQLYLCRNCKIIIEALLINGWTERDVVCPKCTLKDIEWVPATFGVQFRSNALGPYRGAASNPYENLTLQHVHDEHGKPIKVNSLKELRAAQKKYGFSHAVSDTTSQEALDTPPQHESWAGDVRHGYKWKWTPPEQRDDISGVDVGSTTRDKLMVGA